MTEFTDRQLLRIAADALAIGDRFFHRAEVLDLIGFRSHRIFFERGKILCSADEWTESLEIAREVAKEKVASYWQNPLPLHGLSGGYRSQKLERIRENRELSGHGKYWFRTTDKDEYKYYLDAATRELEKMFSSSDANADAFKKDVSNAGLVAAADEKAILAGKLTFNLQLREHQTAWNLDRNQNQQLRSISLSLLEPLLADIEFVLDKRTKRQTVFRFVRKIVDRLQLRLLVAVGGGQIEWRIFLCFEDLPPRPNGIFPLLYGVNEIFEFRIAAATAGGIVYSQFDTISGLEIALLANIEMLKSEIDYVVGCIRLEFS